ncbi:reverse transcriptase [Plakobranchus ocellatus]|uniref:Reverse transcriptase n=1 Tax=Plakobranchus ocellatus TaxID=259542 RepID=A0AAV3ZVW9_9GAST|nr:reverse transcriptase [Plakobranchus ocellatus]
MHNAPDCGRMRHEASPRQCHFLAIYTNWSPRQPDDWYLTKGEDCAVALLRGARWNDLTCAAKMPYICERPILSSAVGQCPAKWSKNPSTGTCIQMGGQPKRWQAARAECKKRGGDLVTIVDDYMNTFVNKIRKESVDEISWIGLNKMPSGGNFSWSNENQQVKYTKWAAKNSGKNSKVKNCVVTGVNDVGEWAALKCAERRDFICERQPVCPLVDGICPSGWIKSPDSCIKFYDQERTWTDAREVCKKDDADLVTILDECMSKMIEENGYINTSVQKGGIPGVSGCLEHATMVWEAIQRAKSEKLNLDVVWPDLANAYGSVPHEMIQLSLRMYHVLEVIQVMPDDYLSEFCMRFSTNDYRTNWINLEVGIAMGCTISPILFVMAMEVILKAAEGSAGPASLGGGCSMPPLKAFMDDTTIICSKEDETRRMLTRLYVLMSWCRMEFKPKKSRSLSIRKGNVDEAMTFTVAEQQIPTVSQEPVKSLGRWYDSSIKDTRRGAETLDLASESLLAINKCGLQGKFKIWCLQFMLIPKLLWPLLVYDICSTTVETIGAKINKYTTKRLGVPPGLSEVAMYCR